MKNVSRMMSSALSILLIFGVAFTPTLSFAGGGSCDAFCGNTKDGIANLIQDPKCKADPKCVSCVGNTLGNSQIASYCTAYQSSSKSEKKQTIQTATYVATAVTCITACALQAAVVTSAAGATLARVCGGLGLAAAGMELIFALSSNDLAGGAMGAIGGIGRAGKNIALVTGKVVPVAVGKTGTLKALSKNPACVTGVMYGVLSGLKLASGKSMKKAKKSQCDIIGNFGSSANAAVQSCQLGNIATPPSTGDAGMFAATASSFAAPNLNDGVNQLGVNATDQFIKDMRGDLKAAEDAGKFNYGDLAKRVDEGESLGSLLGGAGAPPAVLSAILDGEARVLKGEKLKGLEGLDGGYSAGGAGTELAGTNSGANEMAFASNTAAGEGVLHVDIERAPASEAQSGLANDGDILHTAFGGTIFDIVSLRIKEQKGKYAEAEPEGRMNRAFNGFSNRERQPASK